MSSNIKKTSNKLCLNLSSANNNVTQKVDREERCLLCHAYLPVISLVFWEVENLFGGLVPFIVRVLPGLRWKHQIKTGHEQQVEEN